MRIRWLLSRSELYLRTVPVLEESWSFNDKVSSSQAAPLSGLLSRCRISHLHKALVWCLIRIGYLLAHIVLIQANIGCSWLRFLLYAHHIIALPRLLSLFEYALPVLILLDLERLVVLL